MKDLNCFDIAEVLSISYESSPSAEDSVNKALAVGWKLLSVGTDPYGRHYYSIGRPDGVDRNF